MPMTPNKSSCSRFGQWLAIFSKSRSVSPRIAAKKSFFNFGQPLSSSLRLSPGDASSRKLNDGWELPIEIDPKLCGETITYHQPKSTSSSSVHVASASSPIADRPCDFHISMDTIFLLYCDIVNEISSMFTCPNAKLICFNSRLFFSIIMICSSAMSAWNKSNRSKWRNRPSWFPSMSRSTAFRSESSVQMKVASILAVDRISISNEFTSEILTYDANRF